MLSSNLHLISIFFTTILTCHDGGDGGNVFLIVDSQYYSVTDVFIGFIGFQGFCYLSFREVSRKLDIGFQVSSFLGFYGFLWVSQV
jgi:hypothetical protein